MLTPDQFRALISGQSRDPWSRLMRGGLVLAEYPYAWAMRWRNARYDQGRARVYRVEVPVMSVGNLTLGGTGKTPMVAWLARWFRQHGVRVSIVSRGYGQRGQSANDEARQLAACLPDVPHLQNVDRVAGARTAIDAMQSQLILLDDGFQHRRLARDLDLVLIDATEPFGYEHIFPRGLLREPIDSLARAQIIALTRCNLVSESRRAELQREIIRWAPDAHVTQAGHRVDGLLTASGQRAPVTHLAGQPVLAVCGIGNPSAFRQTLAAIDVDVVDQWVLADHHPYDAATVARLIRWTETQGKATAVLCTHKDLVKLNIDRLGHLPLWAVTIDVQWYAGLDTLEFRLRELLARIRPE
jgi:tetraacyldisaccharide 4'-kinase